MSPMVSSFRHCCQSTKASFDTMSTSFRAVMMPLMTAVCSHVSSSSSCGAYTLRITTAPFIACHATTMGVPVLGRR